ncbi:hypothetical protein Tco_1444545, partial [Tanacetum coccineum]
ETVKYGKINYFGDIDYLRFFETKFPAIVYDVALSSQHVDEVNWKNKTSLSEYNGGKYNAISENVLGIDKDLFSYDIFSIDNLKSDKDDDEGKIGLMYHDLCLGGKALAGRENVGFDLTKSDLCLSFVKDLIMKGVGLRVADSHTGNHREDGFTPLETI